MVKKYSYKTPRGATVDLSIKINHITKETVDLDGHKVEVEADTYTYSVQSITVNGQKYNGQFYGNDIKVGMQGNQPILVAIPPRVQEDYKAEENEKTSKKIEKMIATEKKYNEHREMMKRAMSE
jgi:hypothetical protein